MNRKICTCRWSRVHSASIDPPDIIWINPDCPHHGHEAHEPDPDDERDRQRDDAVFFRGWAEDDWEE